MSVSQSPTYTHTHPAAVEGLRGGEIPQKGVLELYRFPSFATNGIAWQ